MADDLPPFPGKALGSGDYQIADEELADAVVIRPGMRNPEDPDHVRIEPEAITADTILKPLDIVLFYDSRSKRPFQEGVNEQAFVVDENRALYARGIVRSISLSEVRRRTIETDRRLQATDIPMKPAQWLDGDRRKRNMVLLDRFENHPGILNAVRQLTGELKIYPALWG